MRWREKIAEVAGMPPLSLMEGFGPDEQFWWRFRPESLDHAKDLLRSLPIKWSALKSDPLHVLLSHSDCDGEISHADCLPIAERLREILPMMPSGDGGGHIGNWRDKTKSFIDGLLRANEAGEDVKFM